ncbi:hypothetical protein LTR53_008976 [Teratosphaeriaceae sp. CCFEE 6253]|nr:hypothetical protein LTR53_008976 [Teratosphaeriaceae sp. CCFEE 6253]
MLRKLRRASLQWSNKRRDSTIGTHSPCKSIQPDASRLGLPPEIRNQIYEYLATSTTLTVPPVKSRKSPRPVGLLLACRQTYREYRMLLVSKASIVVLISGFDFTNVIRVLQAMSPKDTAALQTNPRLCMSLFLTHVASAEERRYLLKWLNYRAELASEEAIDFDYDVQFNVRLRPPRPAARYVNGYHMKQDLLVTLVRRFVRMRPAVAELVGSTAELDRMMLDLERCAAVLEEIMQSPDQSDGAGDV